MIDGNGLGILRPFFIADKNARTAYSEMQQSAEFLSPISYEDIDINSFDARLSEQPEARLFFARDRHYLSARWPQDAHTLPHELQKMLS